MLYKVKTGTKAVGAGIPAHLTTLAISWMRGRCEAVAIHKGIPTGSWVDQGTVSEDFEDFGRILGDAIRETGYTGRSVTLALSHPRLGQRIVETPLGGGVTLHKLIRRQVRQHKTFAGEAVWACQPLAVPSAKGQRLLIHEFPEALLEQLLRACRSRGLSLVGVFPATAVLHAQLQHFSLGEGAPALLAGSAGGMTAVVVGRQDGGLLLARSIGASWNQDPRAFAVDVNRTILFASEQFGVAVSGVWLFGEGASVNLEEVRKHLRLPVNLSPEEYDEHYWARALARLPFERSPNLISVARREAPQRRRMLALAGLVAIGLLVGTMAAVGYLEIHLRGERKALAAQQARVADLQARQKQVRQQLEELSRNQSLSQLITRDPTPSVPVLFVGYLSEAVPRELMLTNVQVRRVDARWQVRLAGMAQPASGIPAGTAADDALNSLRSTLAEGPFHLALADDSQEAADARSRPQSALDVVATLAAHLKRPAAAMPGRRSPEHLFAIEGTMP